MLERYLQQVGDEWRLDALARAEPLELIDAVARFAVLEVLEHQRLHLLLELARLQIALWPRRCRRRLRLFGILCSGAGSLVVATILNTDHDHVVGVVLLRVVVGIARVQRLVAHQLAARSAPSMLTTAIIVQ